MAILFHCGPHLVVASRLEVRSHRPLWEKVRSLMPAEWPLNRRTTALNRKVSIFFLLDIKIVMFNFINKLNNGSHFHASVKITDHSYARFFRYIKLKGLYITPHPRPLFGRSHLQHGFASPYPNSKAIKSYNKR